MKINIMLTFLRELYIKRLAGFSSIYFLEPQMEVVLFEFGKLYIAAGWHSPTSGNLATTLKTMEMYVYVS